MPAKIVLTNNEDLTKAIVALDEAGITFYIELEKATDEQNNLSVVHKARTMGPSIFSASKLAALNSIPFLMNPVPPPTTRWYIDDIEQGSIGVISHKFPILAIAGSGKSAFPRPLEEIILEDNRSVLISRLNKIAELKAPELLDERLEPKSKYIPKSVPSVYINKNKKKKRRK